MSEIRRTFFADSVSGATVQLRRHPQLSPQPDSHTGLQLLQVNLVMAGTADTAFFRANCTNYDVIIRRRT